MAYNSVGSITSKDQSHDRASSGTTNFVKQNKTTYQFDYKYEGTQPHAPNHIGDKAYQYDANGNQTRWDHDISGQKRTLVWDEENRLRALSDNGATSFYIYDAQNIRILKGHISRQKVFLNHKLAGGGGFTGNYTVYVNPYLVLRSGSYTKHYYIESQKVVSKLGDTPQLGITNKQAGGGVVNFGLKKGKAHEGLVKNIKFLAADSTFLTAGKSGKVPPGQINGTFVPPGQSVVGEIFQFFYHPDHLGSTSYITDAAGEVYQHLQYFPFGETMVEEHSNTWRTPYLFNGKELDEETGLYYYGARYYMCWLGRWAKPDPIGIKGGINLFRFSRDNPIVFMDPNGTEETSATNFSKADFSKSIFNRDGMNTFDTSATINFLDKKYAQLYEQS
ncbi:MAG: RHS repeat-associated core domain-containing protein, partial [Bacteroidetes bacterium]|nr:RHS repeat-associated core domain-containing protein [Bacteroidota bacterium]